MKDETLKSLDLSPSDDHQFEVCVIPFDWVGGLN